jgi:hypothetical protein
MQPIQIGLAGKAAVVENAWHQKGYCISAIFIDDLPTLISSAAAKRTQLAEANQL